MENPLLIYENIPSAILTKFGRTSNIYKHSISALIHDFKESGNDSRTESFIQWKKQTEKIYGKISIPDIKADLHKTFGQEVYPDICLFVNQSYFALIVILFCAQLAFLKNRGCTINDHIKNQTNQTLIDTIERIENGDLFIQQGIDNIKMPEYYCWHKFWRSDNGLQVIRNIIIAVSEFEPNIAYSLTAKCKDFFQPLYMDIIPRQIRHSLGEYYTVQWLSEFVLQEMDIKNPFNKRCLDPFCGSGSFILSLTNLFMEYGLKNHIATDVILETILDKVHGYDLNPLAILTARANYFYAIYPLQTEVRPLHFPVYEADILSNTRISRAGSKEALYDVIAGNPPWVRWDHLNHEMREKTFPLWKEYGLFSLSGYQSRLGGGKKDISMLYTYFVADKYLKDKGLLGFLITNEVFKSKGAGEGFRRFHVPQSNIPLNIKKVHDLSALQPFHNASNKSALFVLEKGVQTKYPVPYTVWKWKNGLGKSSLLDKNLDTVIHEIEENELKAMPLDSSCGPWITLPADSKLNRLEIYGKNDYIARSGAILVPYGVFWIRILEILDNGNFLIENMTERGKTQLDKVQTEIEPDLVYWGLRGSDIKRWGYTPFVNVIMTQAPETRKPVRKQKMQENYPLTYNYLTRFRDIFQARKSKAVMGLADKTEFYAILGVGKYTVSKYKVVWKQMSTDISACVVGQENTFETIKPVIPLHTTGLIACDNESEAHYLCCILNSNIVRDFVKSFSSAGRGFGSPYVVNQIAIRKYRKGNRLHNRLANLSIQMHSEIVKSDKSEYKINEIENEIEHSIEKYFRDKK